MNETGHDDYPFKHAIETIAFVLGDLLGFFFRLGVATYVGGRRLYIRRKLRFPETCSTRDELYENGLKILYVAKKNITVVSTVPEEDLPFKPRQSVSDSPIRDYFIALHGIAYRNLLGGEGKTEITRHTNFLDPEKCHEAFSLLYYGAAVEIRHSQLPVEFLTADQRSILIGFPSPGAKLLNGIRLAGADTCKAMVNWVETHGANRAGALTPKELAQQIIKERGPHKDDACLCNIVSFLEDNKPAYYCANQFDHISKWYTWLYEGNDDIDRKALYRDLAEFLRVKFRFPKRYRFLDIGCGPAFGATELQEKGIRYYGLDASKQMIDVARRNGIRTAYYCDAIGTLMDVDPRGEAFLKKLRKNKFNVIACQGNTFDVFLGTPQKALALFLFDKYLTDNGILLFTGHKFTKGDESKVYRKFPGGNNFHYEPKWFGDYMQLTVMGGDGNVDAELMHHPCSYDWLRAFLEKLGYQEEKINMKWFGPSGEKEPYYLWAFRRHQKPEEK